MSDQMTPEQVRDRLLSMTNEVEYPWDEDCKKMAESIDAHLNAAKGEVVAWTVVGPDGKTSIGGWHDMRTFEHIKGWATLREGHQYAFAYAHPASPDVARDAERYRIVRNYYGVDLDDSDRRVYHDALDRQLDKDINEFGAKAMAAREGGE